MHRLARRPRPFAALSAAAALCIALPALAAEITDVRVGVHPKFTRIVFELDGRAGYQVERAGSDAAPELRITIEATSSARELRASGDVRGVKVDAGTKARAHIALRQPGLRVREMMLSDPPRIVIDLHKPETAVAEAAKPAPKPKAAAKERPAPAPAPAPKEVAKEIPKPAPAPKEVAKESPKPAPPPKEVAKATPKAEVAPAPKAAPPPPPAPEAPKAAAAPPTPAPAPEEIAPTPPAPPTGESALKPAPRVTPPPTETALANKPALPAPEAPMSAAAPTPVPAPAPTIPPPAPPAPTPESVAEQPPAPIAPTPPAAKSPSPVRPTPAPAPAPPAPSGSWSARLTSDPIWIGGIAAALLGVAATVLVLRRRRALPNDLDVTAIAEEVEQTSDAPGRIPSGGFAMGDDGAMPPPASFAQRPEGERRPEETTLSGLFDKPAARAPVWPAPPTTAKPAPTSSATAEDSLFDDAGDQAGEPDASEGDAPMNQEMDLPVDRHTSPPAARMGGSAAPSPDIARMLQDFERRIATLESRLDDSNEAREKLERQVAAQSEELRVQRAAIARTQRALRTMTRGDEDRATEPALRDGDTQAKTRVTP